jgi:RsiW-degrading membrane proteinase PrsW (M82 family)
MGVILSILSGFSTAFVFALIIYWLDRYEKEPWLLLTAVFLWGVFVAAGGAFIANTIFGVAIFVATESDIAAEASTAIISAPVVEESLKGFAVVIVFFFFRKEFDNILDGIVYGGVVALGFAATENSLYIYRGYAEAGLGGFIVLSFIRNVIVGWQHPFYTAFIGIGLAVARLNRNTLVKLTAPVVGWVAAVGTHSLHNALATFLSGLGGLAFGTFLDWTGWLFMLIVIIWAIRREGKFMATYLSEEVDLGNLTAAQYGVACSGWAMTKARTAALTGGGSYGKTSRFYKLCAELSHKKRQLEKLGDEGRNTRIIGELRTELMGLSPQVPA